jgi:hypothetical protein
MTQKHQISFFLQRVRRRFILRYGITALPLLGFASLLLFGLLWWRGAPFWPTSLLLLAAVCLIFVSTLVWRLRQTSLSDMARWVEQHSEIFTRGYLVGSLEFASSTRFDQPFARAVTEQTAATLSQVKASQLVPLWPLPASFYPSLASLLALLTLLWVTPDAGRSSPSNTFAAPVVGDLFVQYEYPKYSKLPPRTIEGLSGTISALKGTRVSLKTRADRPIIAANITIDGSEKQIPLRVTGDRHLEGDFTLLEDHSFRFVIQDDTGAWIAGPSQAMKAETDLVPTVELLSPTTDLELKELDQLDLEVSIEDDFALRSLRIVFEIEGISTPQIIEVTAFKDRKRSFRGVLKQPLADLHLKEGDRVRYTVEALDNDVVSGPKRGTSIPRFIKIFSAKEQHQKLIEAQADLVKKLAAHLGSRMEKPFPIVFPGEKPSPSKNDADNLAKEFLALSLVAEQLVSVADGIALSLAEDALSHPEIRGGLRTIAGHLTEQASEDLEQIKALRAGASSALSSRLQSSYTHNKKCIATLEEDVFTLDSLVKRQRAENVRSIAEELSAAKDRLKQLIEEFEKTKDPKLKEQIQREIERLEALLASYQQELAKMQEEMPEEFFNLEALQADEMKDNLKKAKESIAKGDVSAAKKALAQLSEALNEDQEKLDEEASRFADAEQQKRDKEAEQLLQDLSKVENEEKRLLQETQAIEKSAHAKAEKMNQEPINAAKAEAAKKLDQVESLLREIDADALSDSALLANSSATDRVEELDAALSTKPLFEIFPAVQSLLDALQVYQTRLSEQAKEESERSDLDGRLASLKVASATLERAHKLTEEILALLQKVTPSLDAYLSVEEKAALAALQKAQVENQAALEPLREKMQKLAAIFQTESTPPSSKGAVPPPPKDLPPEVKKLLSEAGQAMESAANELKKAHPTPSLAKEKEALQKLQELRQLIKNSGKKNQPKERSQKVKIPTAEEYEPPRDYRDEVIEGSKEKEKASPRYQEALKKYYQELLQ